MKHFKFYSKEDILSLTKVRRFETKIGERLQYLKFDGEWPEDLVHSSAKYVVIGIPEDIGVLANYGGWWYRKYLASFPVIFFKCKIKRFFNGRKYFITWPF